MIKRILKILLGIVLVGLIALLGIYLEDRHFWNRYFKVLKSPTKVLPQDGWAGSEYEVKGGSHELFQLTSAADSIITQDALQTVTDYAAERNSSSFLVWHDGNLLVREHFQGLDEEDLIVGKSMAKMVVGVVVGRAIKEGHLEGLDEPASNYITEWKGTEKEKITIRHLLHMSPGFETYYTRDTGPFGKFMRSYISGKTEKYIIDKYQLINEPGTVYDYSQVTSDLLGVVLERATGVPYGDYLSSSLIQPLNAQGGEVMMNRPDGLAHTGCCLLLPSESWLRFGIFLMNGGIVDGQNYMPEGWMADYLAPSPSNPALGLHIWLGKPHWKQRSVAFIGEAPMYGTLHSEPYLADDLFLFDGNGHQVVYIVPSKKLVVVRTGNKPSKDKAWDNSFIPNTLIRGMAQ